MPLLNKASTQKKRLLFSALFMRSSTAVVEKVHSKCSQYKHALWLVRGLDYRIYSNKL